jgi:putative transcriptional regulator
MAQAKRRRVEVWMQTKDAGQPLARARKRARLTQRELAFLARCSQTMIYLLETGRLKTCSDDLALRIVDRLPVDLEDVFVERAASCAPPMTSDPVSGVA